MESTTPTDAPNPIIIFIKSLVIKGNTVLNFSLPVTVAIASSRPHSSPTNTQVVDIGISFSSLKKNKISQYTPSIIVADLTYLVLCFSNTICCILPPPSRNIYIPCLR